MTHLNLRRTGVCICFGLVGIIVSIIAMIIADIIWNYIPVEISLINRWLALGLLSGLLLGYIAGHLFGRRLYDTHAIAWRLQFLGSILFPGIIMSGFKYIPKELTLFGMGLIPGPLALLSAFGLPLISSCAIGYTLYRRSEANKVINAVFFFVCSIFIWIPAFVLTH